MKSMMVWCGLVWFDLVWFDVCVSEKYKERERGRMESVYNNRKTM